LEKKQFDSYEDHLFLKRSTKLAFGAIGFGETILQEVVTFFMLLFYNTQLMVPATWIGWAFAGTRLWDAVADPVIGHISDNTRTRWGRRRPYILFGGLLFALAFVAMCVPPKGLTDKGNFLYLAIVAFLYYTFYAATFIPAGGLGAELSLDYHERTRLNAYRNLFSRVGAIVAGFTWFLAGRFPTFRQGFLVIGICLGALSFLACLWTFFGTRESGEVQQQAKVPLLKGLRATFSTKPFWILAGAVFFFCLGTMLSFPAAIYINVYYVYGGDSVAAGPIIVVGVLVYNIACILSIPLATWLGVRLGKERTAITATVVFPFALLLSWFVFTPKYPYLQLLFQLPVAVALMMIIVCAGAMMADLVDLDEMRTHMRREGSFAAGLAFVMKLAMAVGTLVFGYMLDLWAGFDPKLPAQTPETVHRLRLILAVVPLIPCAIAAVFALLYPIRERHIREARKVLEERRAEMLQGEAGTAMASSETC
jgi:GPH family glycoside/pentoside/hexuronide:cation symporter